MIIAIAEDFANDTLNTIPLRYPGSGSFATTVLNNAWPLKAPSILQLGGMQLPDQDTKIVQVCLTMNHDQQTETISEAVTINILGAFQLVGSNGAAHLQINSEQYPFRINNLQSTQPQEWHIIYTVATKEVRVFIDQKQQLRTVLPEAITNFAPTVTVSGPPNITSSSLFNNVLSSILVAYDTEPNTLLNATFHHLELTTLSNDGWDYSQTSIIADINKSNPALTNPYISTDVPDSELTFGTNSPTSNIVQSKVYLAGHDESNRTLNINEVSFPLADTHTVYSPIVINDSSELQLSVTE